MNQERNAMTEALRLLAKEQHEHERPPKRRQRKEIVDVIVKVSGLRGDPREQYCRLLMLSALAGQEKFYANWKANSKLVVRSHVRDVGRKSVQQVRRTESPSDTLARWKRRYGNAD